MFCLKHWYSNRHEYRFDYKKGGRVMIAKENLFIKPAKILKVKKIFLEKKDRLSVFKRRCGTSWTSVWWKTEMAATFGCELVWISGIFFWLVF